MAASDALVDRVLIPQWVPHRDERYWNDPEQFDPGRWDRDADRPEYAYVPFSGGPRYCIGMEFARVELTLALATMVGHVDWTSPSTTPLVPSEHYPPPGADHLRDGPSARLSRPRRTGHQLSSSSDGF